MFKKNPLIVVICISEATKGAEEVATDVRKNFYVKKGKKKSDHTQGQLPQDPT